MRYKVVIEITVDPDEYPVPVDGNVEEDLGHDVESAVADLNGVRVKQIVVKKSR